MVEILALYVKLNITERAGETLQMGDGGGSALKLTADAAQLAYKSGGLADGEIGLGYLFHGLLKFGLDVASAVSAEITLLIGVVFEIGIEIHTAVIHFYILRNNYILFDVAAKAQRRHRLVYSFILSSSAKEKRPGQTSTYLSRTNKNYPRCHLDFTALTLYPQRNTNIFPATDVCPTSQNTQRIFAFDCALSGPFADVFLT